MRLVLDTSVAVAWYLPEEFSQPAREWRERFLRGEIRLSVPSLHYAEFANVLRTYVRRGEIASGLATEVYRLHAEAPLEIAETERATLLATALDFQSTAYDAVYIQLVLKLKAPLLTAERTTTPWVVKLGKLARVVP